MQQMTLMNVVFAVVITAPVLTVPVCLMAMQWKIIVECVTQTRTMIAYKIAPETGVVMKKLMNVAFVVAITPPVWINAVFQMVPTIV